MAGHSKWANIKHSKARVDAKRGKVFTKLTRQILAAVKLSGPDPLSNPRLRAAIKDALSANMTRKQIDSAIKRGAGNDEADVMIAMRYEGYGPGGVAIIIDCLGDNKNRMVAEVRHALTKSGGNLGTDGSVSYMFQERGLLAFPSDTDEDALMEAALEAGAEDFSTNDDGSMEVLTAPNDYETVKETLTEAGYTPESASLGWLADNTVSLDTDTGVKLLKLIDKLEDLDDVQNVYTNGDISGESIEAFSAL